MNLGKQTLYNHLVPNSLDTTEKGSNDIELRNDCLACRFYYYTVICRLRYDDCLMHLYKEWFIKPPQIIKQLKKRTAFTQRLLDDKVTTAELRRRYPHFDWSGRVNMFVTG